MAKYIIALIIVTIGIFCEVNSQNKFMLKGTIIDKKNNYPIPYATIIVKNKQIGSITDSLGQFRLLMDSTILDDSLIISHISYKSDKKKIRNYVFNEKMQIELTRKNVKIEDVIIRIPDVDKIVKNAIKKYNEQICKHPYIAKAYYSEKARKNGKYIKYTDGLGFLISMGYNFEVPTNSFSILSTNIRKCTPKDEWLDYLKYQNKIAKNRTDITPAHRSVLSSSRWFEIKGPYSSPNCFNYELDTIIHTNMQIIYGIRFMPDTNSIFSFSCKNSHHGIYYSGILYINKQTLRINRVELYKSPFYSDPFDKYVKANFNFNYAYYYNKCFYSKIEIFYTNNDLEHWNTINIYQNKLQNLQISDREFWTKFSANSVNPFVFYNEDKWENVHLSIINDISKIKNDLSKDSITIKQQFKNNSSELYWKYKTDIKSLEWYNNYNYYEKKIKQFNKLFE